MAYASVADVQARIRASLLTIGGASEPSTSTVTDWLDQWSLWIDQTLRWRYAVPVTHADDLKILKPICSALVAAECWGVLSPASPGQENRGPELRSQALAALAYQPATSREYVPGVGTQTVSKSAELAGKSFLVLPNTALSDSGEASLGQPVSTFTDPDAEDGHPRLFTMDMVL